MNFKDYGYDEFEDFLINMGFVQSSSGAITDIESRNEQLESIVHILCKQVVVMEAVMKYAIQSRIGGYTSDKGKCMELFITGESLEPKPTMFDRIEEIIKQEVDTDQPWLN